MARRTPSLQDALDEYFTTRLHTAQNTQINDRSVLNGFVRSFGDLQTGHLTPQRVEHYFFGPGGAIHRYNARSYNKVRQRVAGFLAFCAARGYNRAPLLANVHARKVMQQELRLTPDQMVQMSTSCSPPSTDPASTASPCRRMWVRLVQAVCGPTLGSHILRSWFNGRFGASGSRWAPARGSTPCVDPPPSRSSPR